MPATPAWPPKSTPRLYLDQPIAEGAQIELEQHHARYLLNVMRRSEDDVVRLFDDRTGEYLARLAATGGGRCVAHVEQKLAEREDVPDLWLCLSPLQRDNMALVAEKACELGVRRFVPAEMDRSIVRRINGDRLRKRMIEAAEQCERTALPELAPLVKLEQLLADWPAERSLFFCDERGGGSFRAGLRAHDGPAALLIGPEGGFTDRENDAIRALPQAVPISLGPRILRAETAAIAATSIWMAGRGDWD